MIQYRNIYLYSYSIENYIGGFKMNDKEMKQDRFTLHENNIRVTFMPQCNKCKININGTKCKQFEVKPLELMKNKLICKSFTKYDSQK